jgi:hypothetical protein
MANLEYRPDGSMSVTELSVDGVATDLISLRISIPNVAGGDLVVEGFLRRVGQPAPGVAVTGGQLKMPGTPPSGSIFWVLQIDYLSGLASIKTSTSSYPSADATAMIVFSQTLTSSTTNPGTDLTIVTPD